MDIDGKGIQGEEFVNELAYSSYLKFWCYPEPKDEFGDKKEIADLLILFKEVAIIVSVKNYEFKGQYERYFRRTISKAVSQIYGAERKLFGSKGEVFIKHPQKEVEKFVPNQYDRILRLIVNLGDDVQFYPTGLLTNGGKYVHVLDKTSFEAIVNELDTIPDLVDYFLSKESIFNGKDVVILPGEEHVFDEETGEQYFKFLKESFSQGDKKSIIISGREQDLLAKYLEGDRKFGEYFGEDYTNMLLDIDGAWDNYLQREEVVLKKSHDKISYFIDELVEKEVLVNNSEFNVSLARELLSLNRFERRIIGQGFFEVFKQYAGNDGWHMGRRHGKVGEILISFIVYGKSMKDEAVNTFLELALKGYSLFEGFKTAKSVLIAVNSDMSQFKLGYVVDIVPFDAEYEVLLRQDLKKMKWFQNPTMTPYSFQEYPESNQS